MPEALFQPKDSRRFRAHVAQLLHRGHRVARLPNGQLKVGRYSFFPDTGAIWCDQAGKMRQRGFHAFLDILDGTLAALRPRSPSVRPQASDDAAMEIATVDLGLLQADPIPEENVSGGRVSFETALLRHDRLVQTAEVFN